MRPDRSKNDLIVLGMVGVLAIVAVGVVAAVLWEREIPEAMSSLAVGIVGGVLGYVTAGRSKSVEDEDSGQSVGLVGAVGPIAGTAAGAGVDVAPVAETADSYPVEGEWVEDGDGDDGWFDDADEYVDVDGQPGGPDMGEGSGFFDDEAVDQGQAVEDVGSDGVPNVSTTDPQNRPPQQWDT